MNKKYKVSQLYLVRLAQTTKVIPSGWQTKGATFSRHDPEVYFAKIVKKEENTLFPSKSKHYFKILTKNLIVHDRHDHPQVGDYFVYEKTPVSMVFDGDVKYIDFKSMRPLERSMNTPEAQTKNEGERTKG